ncbi:MAG: hypothetical protein JWR26_1294 [Pedosphaera sp.]|nr:hypothetical protein [Pedosphaera sp.]
MTFLPIVERELRLAARLTTTYRNRMIVAGVVTLVAILMLLIGIMGSVPSRVGAGMFGTLASMAMVFCLFEGVRKTADCISEEKREGTLGLLFLTDLRGYDIVLGKLAAMSLASVYGLLAIMPVLALPLLVGGVTAGEFWRMALALTNILFFSLCAGIWASWWSREEREARGRTILVIALVVGIPLFMGAMGANVLSVSPAYAFHLAFASAYGRAPEAFWESIGITQGLCWFLLAWSAYAVPGCWQENPGVVQSAGSWLSRERLRYGEVTQRAARRTKMLDINPIFWLAARDRSQRLSLLLYLGVLSLAFVIVTISFKLLFLPSFIVFALVMNLLLKMRVASQACHCLAEARRNNALELMLSTPLTVDEIIKGQFSALKHIFLAPIITIVSIETIVIVGGFAAFGDMDMTLSTMFYVIPIYLCIAMMDMAAVSWMGMCYGLSSKKESQAVTKTIFVVLILPLFGAVTGCLAILFIIGWPMIWMAVGSTKLRGEFRKMAEERYSPPSEIFGWGQGAGGHQGNQLEATKIN